MYGKLFESIYQGTLRGDSNGLLVFTNLIAHSDKEGHVDVHPRAIADEIGIPIEAVRETLLRLEEPDPESRSPEEEGRRIVRLDVHRAWGWRIVNYGKYRAIRNEEDRREQNRNSQAAYRNRNKPPSAENKQASAKRQRASAVSAHTDTDTEADTEAKKEKGTPVVVLSVESLVDLGVEREHAAAWFKVRGKVPLTETAWKAVLREAAKADMTPAEAVQKSAEKGWRGFEAKWLTAPAQAPKGDAAARAAVNAEFIRRVGGQPGV